MISFSLIFVNRHNECFKYSSLIEEVDGYDTIFCHGAEYSVYITNNEGVELEYSPVEFANIIINSSSYSGNSIRLISCNTGTRDDGFAQQLANIMSVVVLAPTEAIWVNSYGELFITDNDVIAQMWYDGNPVKETGRWRKFIPQKGAEDEEFNKL